MKHFIPSTKAAISLAASLATGVLLTACGGGSDNSPASSVTPDAAASTTQQDAPPAVALTSLAQQPADLGTAGDQNNGSPSEASDADDVSAASDGAFNSAPTVHPQAVTAPDYTLYVSQQGDDRWSGLLTQPNATRTDGPLRSIPGAQKKVRTVLSAMNVGSQARARVRVMIAPGEYPISATLAFTPADSGTADAPVSYEATPGSVTISGGTVLNIASVGSGSTPFVFNAPSSTINWRGGGQLYINGTRATLARQPNAGSYWFVQQPVPMSTEPADQQGREAFTTSPDAKSWLDTLSSTDKQRALVNVYYAWTLGHHRISTQAAPAGSVRIAPRSYWTFLDAGSSQRFYVENVPKAMDVAGEWYGDSSGIRYLPFAAESSTRPRAVLTTLEKLVTVTGDLSRGNWVKHLQFKGLSFAYTKSQVPDGGLLDWQAAIQVSAAIEVDGASNVLFDKIGVSRAGGYGIWLRQAVRDSAITDSTFADMGAGGIKVGMYNQSPTDLMVTGANKVTGNRVGRIGKISPSAVGIWIGQSFDNNVSYNAIYDTTYSGISVGWTWGFGPATSGRNTVNNNLLVNIGRGELSDMGGIYAVGVSPGTTISNNLIREVRGYPGYGAGAWGLYLDSGASQIALANNVVIGTTSGSFHLNTGQNNALNNNLMGWGDKAEMRVTLQNTTPQVAAAGNLMIPKPQQPFDLYAQSPDVSFTGNLVSDRYATSGLNLNKCGAGCGPSTATLNVTTDPRGVTLLGADSATTNQVAGTVAKSGPPQVNDATILTSVPQEPPPVVVAPPLSFQPDISNTAIGSRPLGLWYSTSDPAAISVVADAVATGGRCLRLADAPSNTNSYDPHIYGPLNHASGTTTGEFALLIDASTNFQHQWRDNGNPFKTGPSLTVTAGGVKVGSTIVAPVTVGQWMKFKLVATLGGNGSTWSLTITDGQNKTTTVNNLPFVSTGFGSLNWWGFVSQATTSTKLCLADMKATNVQ